jgi:hypothetical protein
MLTIGGAWIGTASFGFADIGKFEDLGAPTETTPDTNCPVSVGEPSHRRCVLAPQQPRARCSSALAIGLSSEAREPVAEPPSRSTLDDGRHSSSSARTSR